MLPHSTNATINLEFLDEVFQCLAKKQSCDLDAQFVTMKLISNIATHFMELDIFQKEKVMCKVVLELFSTKDIYIQ